MQFALFLSLLDCLRGLKINEMLTKSVLPHETLDRCLHIKESFYDSIQKIPLFCKMLELSSFLLY